MRAAPVWTALALFGCATGRPGPSARDGPTWSCTSEIRDGEVVGSSSLILEADGAVRAVQNHWRWSAEGARGASILIEQWGDSALLQISLRFRSSRHLRIRAFELRLGDVALPLADGSIARDSVEPGNYLRVPADDLLRAAASGQSLDAVGIGLRGGVAVRMPLDPGAIARGRRALAQAIPRAVAMSRDPAGQCQDISWDGVTIAARAPLAEASGAS
ncbi:MAG: hypothetical protein QOI38_937 [Sphingomonadales bacterium]|jgi:hypothetical protein|nr:hypothetical protein [Sphingomonadales bacterium]